MTLTLTPACNIVGVTVVCNIALSSGSCLRSPRAATATESGDCRLESTVSSARDVAAAVGAHGDEPRLLKASRDEHQAVAEDPGTFENPSSYPTRRISRPVSGS